ncbi:MAG: glycosyltransferase family 2 protein [Halioglobus sp.]
MTSRLRCVGAVVLTYNSTEDLPKCLSGLLAQRGVDLRIIVVDNASRCEDLAAMEAHFTTSFQDGRVLFVDEACAEDLQEVPAIFLRNAVNGGYSAGNNIGARMASAIGCEAVLILNPDVRLSDPDYVATLAALIAADERTALACSAVRNLSGDQENPMSEPSLFEELLWPVKMIATGLLRRSKPAPQLPEMPFKIEKVTGSCFLIRTDFLKLIGYFDQSVFLYCEESILMMQVRSQGWHMMMEPRIEALHAHRSDAKGAQFLRFRAWSDSRRYFHASYGKHSTLSQAMLCLARWMMLRLVQAQDCLRRIAKQSASP